MRELKAGPPPRAWKNLRGDRVTKDHRSQVGTNWTKGAAQVHACGERTETISNWESNELDWAIPGEWRMGPIRVGGSWIAVLSHCNTVTLSCGAPAEIEETIVESVLILR